MHYQTSHLKQFLLFPHEVYAIFLYFLPFKLSALE